MARTLAAVPDLEQELDRLYGLPPEQFTPARNDLARRLRQAGQDEAAERIRALKKPSVPVWAVNQLARRDPETVNELVVVGERLRRAQEDALGGAGADAVRDATADERAAVRKLTHRAQDLLREERRTASRQTLERIATTLRAAAVDPEAAKLLTAGRLAEELDSPGFAAVAELAPRRPPKRESDSAKRTREKERRDLEARIARLERRLHEANARVDRAEAALGDARDRAAAIRQEIDDARLALDESE